MQVLAAEDLIAALRGSGLFTHEQVEAMVRELAPLGVDSTAMMRQLLTSRRLTRYQLKKVAHGKGAELRVGPYIVTDKLGEGGMGKVYRARRANGGTDVLALKVVRSALVANPVVRGRYAREVQTTGTLDHPNIVRLFDAGEDGGRFYLAMEFVDGIDLARLMQIYGRVEVAEACEYVRQMALGLAHAHAKGFVHRDIKPSNVVVAGARHLPQATEAPVVKLLDLGLARAIDPDDMVVPNLTRDHTVVGTPDYMAPEQARDVRHPDPRSDLYSLGCTFYFLLAGQVPFPHGSPIEKIIAQQSQMPLPIQSLRPEVSNELAALLSQLLAKRPEDRVQSAVELVALLTPFARYPDGTAPVEVTIRDSETNPAIATTPGGTATSSVSSVSSPMVLDLVEEKSTRPAAARPNQTPRSKVGSVKQLKRTASSARRSRLPAAESQPRGVPQYVWIGVALLGVALLGVMLLLIANS